MLNWTFSSHKSSLLEDKGNIALRVLGFVSAIVCLLMTPVLHANKTGSAAASEGDLLIDVLYIEQRIEHPPVLSNLVSWPEDEGWQGATLGISDNNTTGRFLGQEYSLKTVVFESDEPAQSTLAKVREELAKGARLVVLNLPAELLLEVADMPEAADDLLFNTQSTDNDLRHSECRANVLHTMPSRAMLSDGLIQFFTKRQWKQVFLIEGNRAGDKAFADSIRQSVAKFGLKIVEDKQWIDNADMRRNASNEVPVFTQARKYDVVVVVDEDQDYSQYILYNTWLPRPVAGSAGLTPVAWSPVIEQWGAAQLQSRFRKLSTRAMTSRDYANWAAVRAIGEAVTRVQSAQPESIREYLMSEDFELGGFKGAPLSFRQWNGQMRQSIQLVHAKAVVATAPIEGFLHARTELDTLGLDSPNSKCSVF